MSDTAKETCPHTPCMNKSEKQKAKGKQKKEKSSASSEPSTALKRSSSPVKQEVGETLKSEDQDPNKDLIGRPLLFTGVVAVGVIKKILLPSACASLGAAAVGQSSDGEKKGEKVLVRPRDLPIYSTEPVKEKCEPKPSSTDSAITSTVRQIREGTWAMLDQMKVLTNQACDVIETGKAHTSSTITFLREEENAIPRYGAIGLGGLAGLLLSFRRGIFKRLLYTTTGAVGMAALLYPQEAREYSADGIKIAKKYIIVGYHFINGDEQKEEKRVKRKADKTMSKSKKQLLDKPQEPECLCPDKDNKCPDSPDPSNPDVKDQ